ncbi:MAG: hypothetical protein IT318_14500 [Anaerolineales bacterium]|nr:hypothetical protein [Anaerolineales bacterium]
MRANVLGWRGEFVEVRAARQQAYDLMANAFSPMNWPNALPLGRLALLGTAADQEELRGLRTGYAHPESLVEAARLADYLDEATVPIIEVLWGDGPDYGRAGYEQGHIPGAVLWDYAEDLSTAGTPGNVASPESMQALLSRSEIGPETTVVVHSALTTCWPPMPGGCSGTTATATFACETGTRASGRPKAFRSAARRRTPLPQVAPCRHPTEEGHSRPAEAELL